jgi:hypothetical protein
MWESAGCGRRRRFQLRILRAGPFIAYPDVSLQRHNALYRASRSLVYTVVPHEEPNEYGFNENAWANVGEIRFWGALAFAIEEGKGFYSVHPMGDEHEWHSGGTIWAESLDADVADRFAQRLAAALPTQQHDLHWVIPNETEIVGLHDALLAADNVLLRGVNCYLKSHILWRYPLFTEEMGINLYIALEAGLSVLRRRLSVEANRDVSFNEVQDHVRAKFTHGDALVDFWQDCRDDRNIVFHPDCHLGPQVMHPRSADDIYEMLDPMLSLYRYILIGKLRPTFEAITADVPPNGKSATAGSEEDT